MREPRTRADAPRKILLCLTFLGCLRFFQSSPDCLAAEQVITNAPAVRVASAVPGFRVKNGFHVEVVADDSKVCAPAAMAFDENGRLFVAEMRDYPERREQSPHLGRIRLLEASHANAVFDTSLIYAEDIPLPSAIQCHAGGVFVAATPDIIYLKDVNGDGVADERSVVFSGFGSNVTAFRADSLLNSFAWGLDNRIHGGASGIGGDIITEGKNSEPVMLDRNDFSFDPRALTLLPQAGAAQSGLTFDNRGRKFFSDFTHPLRQAIFEPTYYARNPFFVPAPDSVDSARPLEPIFRLGAVNLAALTRSPAPQRAPVNPIPVPAWFTRARGCVIYRGNAFPTNYVGNAFVADSEAHCIHRMILRENGLTVTASRAPEEQNTEFLMSSDASFRPTQIVNAPDGTLYVADFRDGGESGRILRIVPDNFKQPQRPQLGSAKTYDLVATLAHANGWHRDTAARLLCERRDPAAMGLLTNMIYNARNPLARLHAMGTLQALGGVSEPVVLKTLRDSDPAIRTRALLLCETLVSDGLISEGLWNQLRLMTGDFSADVRYQLALTLGQIRHEGRPQLLAQMLGGAIGDPLLQTAIFSSLGEGAGECFVALASDGTTRYNPAGLELLRRLATMIGTQGSMDEVSPVLDWLDRTKSDGRQVATYVIAGGLGNGLRQAGSSLTSVDPGHRLDRVYAQAFSMSVDYNIAAPLRLEAIRMLRGTTFQFTDLADWFLTLLDGKESPAIQSAAITTLASYSDPRIQTTLTARWSALIPSLTPDSRKQVVAALLGHVERLNSVLDAIENGRIRPQDLTSTDINLLRTDADQGVRQRAVRLFGQLTPHRPAVLERFAPALRLAGDANNGRQIYQARCASCHRVGDSGASFGPDLADMRVLSKEKLLAAIIEPNAELHAPYLTYVIETRSGQLKPGLVPHQNLKTIILSPPTGEDIVLPRSNIQDMQPKPWSLMPEGLEAGLTPKTMADVLEYIVSPTR
jgi:putative membrane-bound dehydrogenase-like protein